MSVAQAEWPSYLLLRPATVPPTKKISHAKPRGIYPGDPYQVRTNAYAYGWFGATSKPKWTCHYGYYDDWRQISIRR